MNSDYYQKYLKYKNKYLQLKNQLGGDYNIADYAAYVRPNVHSDQLPPASRRFFADISLNEVVKLVDQESGINYQNYKYKGLIGTRETFVLIDGNEEDEEYASYVRQSTLNDFLKYNEPIEIDGAFFKDYDQTKWVGCYRYNTINYPDVVLIDINRIEFVEYDRNPEHPRALSLKNEYKYRMFPPIDVTKIGDNYTIRNGNHRLAYSIGMGYTHMPCRIS